MLGFKGIWFSMDIILQGHVHIVSIFRNFDCIYYTYILQIIPWILYLCITI